MKHISVTMIAAATRLAMPLTAAAQGLSAETVEEIVQTLADMQCQMDPDDIESAGDGYELEDVFCADGQYDIRMDSTFAVLEKRKE